MSNLVPISLNIDFQYPTIRNSEYNNYIHRMERISKLISLSGLEAEYCEYAINEKEKERKN